MSQKKNARYVRHPDKALNMFKGYAERLNATLREIFGIPISNHPLLPIQLTDREKKLGTAKMQFQISPRISIPTKMNTNAGKDFVFISIEQDLIALYQRKNEYKLSTPSYKYRIFLLEDDDEPWIGFENHDGEGVAHCQCHAHINIPKYFAGARDGKKIPFKKLHIPTARISIEQFALFLVSDLNAISKKNLDDVHETLKSSHQKFYDDANLDIGL